MQMTSLKQPRLFVLPIACFVCPLVFLHLPTSFVLLKSSLTKRRKLWILLLTPCSLLWKSVMQVLWEDIPRLSPRRLAHPEKFSHLSHFRELWAESPEFRAICRDLGLIPVDFYHLFRVSDMKRRESLCAADGRTFFSDLHKKPKPYFVFQQLKLF